MCALPPITKIPAKLKEKAASPRQFDVFPARVKILDDKKDLEPSPPRKDTKKIRRRHKALSKSKRSEKVAEPGRPQNGEHKGSPRHARYLSDLSRES